MRTPNEKRQAAAPDCALNYIVFNANWDRVVSNAIDQSLRPMTEPVPRDLYVRYLEHSLQSLVVTHEPAQYCITVWLVEIGRRGLEAKEIRQRLEQAVPGLSVNICIVGDCAVRRFIEEACGQPAHLYRSPNAMHEFLLMLILQQ